MKTFKDIDRKLTFKEMINGYDKEALKVLAENHGLSKLSKLKKAELIDRIAEVFLDPAHMFYHICMLDDSEMKLIEKGSEGPAEFLDRDVDKIFQLYDLDLAVFAEDEYVIPDEIAEVIRKVRTPEFEAYRKRASWVWKCIRFAEQFYCYTPMENMVNLVNCKRGFRMTEEELIDVFDRFPQEYLLTHRVGHIFLSEEYADDMEELQDLRDFQHGKDFYIPSVAEVTEFYDTEALISDKEYQDMLHYLVRDLKWPYEDASELVLSLWDMNSSEDDFEETIQWLAEQVEPTNEKQFEKLFSLFMETVNGTRIRSNRGFKPSELVRTALRPGHMPTITAGSSEAAKLLSQAAPEIQKMGFGLDLESNAGTTSIIQFPKGINGSAVVAERKIYPNDPCPCGSGKKYKKCCGRNF